MHTFSLYDIVCAHLHRSLYALYLLLTHVQLFMVLVRLLALDTLVLLQVLVTVTVMLNDVNVLASVIQLQSQGNPILELAASVTQTTVTMKTIIT